MDDNTKTEPTIIEIGVDQPVVDVVEAEVIETSKAEVKVIPVRTEETGDKVYVVRGEKRYWVKNPESLKKLGFNLGAEKKVPFSELLKYSEGEPVDLTLPDAVFPWEKPELPPNSQPTSPHKIWV